MNSKLSRHFILGDEWAYFKIYSGPKTLETILTKELMDIVMRLYATNTVDNFFFIRYEDPDYHLRIRFHLPDVSKLSYIIYLLNTKLKYYLEERLIWKVSADTYNRELERYGKLTILPIEKLFGLDSLSIMNFLKEYKEVRTDKSRWLWGIKCMDSILTTFGLSMSEKILFCKKLNESYSQEFNLNKSIRIQLDKKYRKESKQIAGVIEQQECEFFLGLIHISNYIENAKPIISFIKKLSVQNQLEMSLDNMLASLIHMHFNRLFRTKQRMHEMVIYYFMHKFYTSQAARLKYDNNRRTV